MTDSERAELRTAVSAVLYGSVWDGFNGPTGVTKDEALDYAAVLAKWIHEQIEPRGGRATNESER